MCVRVCVLEGVCVLFANLWPRQLMLGKARQGEAGAGPAAILANCRLRPTFKFVSLDAWQIIELPAAPVKKGFMDLL